MQRLDLGGAHTEGGDESGHQDDGDGLDALYTDLSIPPGGGERPYLFLDMVSSVDGGATAGGDTAKLGGEADHVAFRRLREYADLILVGAGTIRAEDYGPPPRRPEAVARRRARGLAEVPRLAVVSGSLRLDPDARMFSDPGRRPLIITGADPDADRRRALEKVADLLCIGDDHVDLVAVMASLASQGIHRVLCEGGPTLNAVLLDAGLVDELFLTLTPLLVAGPGPRIIDGTIGEVPRPLELIEARHHDSELLLRYRIGT